MVQPLQEKGTPRSDQRLGRCLLYSVAQLIGIFIVIPFVVGFSVVIMYLVIPDSICMGTCIYFCKYHLINERGPPLPGFLKKKSSIFIFFQHTKDPDKRLARLETMVYVLGLVVGLSILHNMSQSVTLHSVEQEQKSHEMRTEMLEEEVFRYFCSF
jgi:hypothetical protein